MFPLFLFLFLFSLLHPTSAQRQFSSFSLQNSPWRPVQNLTLVSPNLTFAAGFLPYQSSYIFAIWFRHTPGPTVTWSLPRLSRSSSLSLSSSGLLYLNDSSGPNLWPSAPRTSNSTQLLLREDGSLVYGNWTSFDYPTDTLLPNQHCNPNRTQLTSRRAPYSYEPGMYSLEACGKLVLNSSDSYWSTDSAIANLTTDGVLMKQNGGTFVLSDMGSPNRLRRLTLDPDGNLRVHSLDPRLNGWVVAWQAVQEACSIIGTCGLGSVCTKLKPGPSPPACICPPGFEPGGQGCTRRLPLGTSARTTFLRLDHVNFTGGSDRAYTGANNSIGCENTCQTDTRCLAFIYRFDGSRYCVHVLDRLVWGVWSQGLPTVTFLKVSVQETEQSNFTGLTNSLDLVCPQTIRLALPPGKNRAMAREIAITSTLFALELLAGAAAFWAFLRKFSEYRNMARTLGLDLVHAGGPKRFTYAELRAATRDFSDAVGQGGFGVVYKGQLPDQRIVAVKRLKDVLRGESDFWAEITIIARMHHLNLVRIWGFCVEKDERLLVYEYVPNGSLDKYLFLKNRGDDDEKTERPQLDWDMRYRIALGVARAIAYLHEECLEWVLHCDIKPENILLEDDFCPKVSDFGLAKKATKKDIVSMSAIRGTKGYLAPEWVRSGTITPKADVYSFGMVLLEIVSGVRNFEFTRSSLESSEWYFPKWVYDKAYIERRIEDVLDQRLIKFYDPNLHFAFVDRMVKTAMWCLQEKQEMRPSMGKVAKMLEGKVEILEPPKPLIFYEDETDASSEL
ncbi:G-type lectin S-receptor-like serine/threonine-protein kinase At1g34300 [Amborella trichopoda]|uniref:non-specific serine/threonine protein kinase n=1 Tax=Amborella trichopoda TaxID=13333 RepID=W1NEJ9_AMBTC|nr:G-type lectin S-receptor-like serine/threonine-protein kinase At1g34300 [Amborella trichopoda]ERM93823.1 hypothetical protein AMTR_s00138p00043730 [Amborella trichopoda]|eukprot:XP_006826586.1 G-type lectin S-receptor-like serine/threonine-protein kinase At1g34300 [Amborella trichopoda]